MLAIIQGILYYHEYLAPKEFVIRTDNISLKYLSKMKHATGRLGRWYLLLNEYKYRTEHVNGKDNVLASGIAGG